MEAVGRLLDIVISYKVKNSKSQKLLGLYIDNKLTFNEMSKTSAKRLAKNYML